MNRNHMLKQLGDERFDLLVIGGGITGAGVAREAALRGLRVALVEARDFAHATSSRSTKLIHGGLRYLKNLEFRLVRESVVERQRLLTMAPHLVKATPFIFPVYRGDPDPLWKLHIGLTLYDWFAGKTNPIPHKMHPAGAIREMEPGLRAEGLLGGAVYADSRTDDGRLTLEVIQSAVFHGAVAANYVRAESFLYDGAGRIMGVTVRDQLTGDTFAVQAGRVLAAAGPWADQIRALEQAGQRPVLRLTKGVHLTVPHQRLPIAHSVVMRGRDGRMMFAVPSCGCTYIGTTDTDHEGDPGAVTITRWDVEYILEAARRTFPESALSEEDIISGWAGLRPLLRPQGAKDPSATTRDYKLFHSPSGLVTVGGGKLTAFRAMAEHIVDDLFPATRSGRHLARSTAPLPGADGPLPTEEEVREMAQKTGVHVADVQALANRYGVHLRQVAAELEALPDGDGDPAERWLRARAHYAVRHEMAVRLIDFVQRRTELMLFTPGNGGPYLERLADAMGDLLGWSEQRRAEEVAACRDEIAAVFAWHKEAVS